MLACNFDMYSRSMYIHIVQSSETLLPLKLFANYGMYVAMIEIIKKFTYCNCGT